MSKLVPKLRFKEFSGEWEEKILKKDNIVSDFIVPMRDKPKDLNGNIPWCRIEDFDGIYLYKSKTNQGVLPKTIKNMNLKVFPKNTLLVSCSADLGRCAITKQELVTNQTFIGLVVNQNKAKVLFSYYLMISLRKKLNALSSGTTIAYLPRQEFERLKILIPTPKEQQKIANTLSSLDSLIEAQQRKVEALKKHKKGLMQQLFPAEGANVPKLRFKEFIGEWEEKKLGEIALLTSSKRIYLSDYIDDGIPFYRGKEISQLRNNEIIDDLLYISEAKYLEIKEKYGVPIKNDILITSVGTIGNIFRIKDNKKFYFKDGNLIWLKDIIIESSFLEYLLTKERDKILMSAIGSSQKALTMVGLNKIEIRIPTTPKEQQKIANTLSSLDNLIEAHQRKVEALKKHKKGLMQQMFVSEEG